MQNHANFARNFGGKQRAGRFLHHHRWHVKSIQGVFKFNLESNWWLFARFHIENFIWMFGPSAKFTRYTCLKKNVFNISECFGDINFVQSYFFEDTFLFFSFFLFFFLKRSILLETCLFHKSHKKLREGIRKGLFEKPTPIPNTTLRHDYCTAC